MKTFLLKQKKHKNGFSAVEIMAIVIVLGIIVSVTLLNFYTSARKKASEASLLDNMRTVQVMLETYKKDWQAYPGNVAQLSNAAKQKKYDKAISNPYSRVNGTVDSGNWVVDLVDPTSGLFLGNPTKYEGKVGYQAIDEKKYYLIGYGEKGLPVEKNKKAFLLTN